MGIYDNFYQLTDKASKYSDRSSDFFIKSLKVKYQSDWWKVFRQISEIYSKKAGRLWNQANNELQRIVEYEKTKQI